MRIHKLLTARKNKSLVFSLIVLAVLSLMPRASQAAVDWTDGFEYSSKTAQNAVWPSSCPGDPNFMFSSTERPRSGSRSLKMEYLGHQAIGSTPPTPGYKSCYMDRYLNGKSDTLYSRWYIYMQNFTVDYIGTKLMRHTPRVDQPGFWWMSFFGNLRLDVSMEGIVNAAGTGTESANLYGGSIPQNQWVCIETRITMSAPGVANGIIQSWVNGAQQINVTNQRMRGTKALFDGSAKYNQPTAQFELIRLYIQDGRGVIYLDDYAVSRDARIGCSGSSPAGDTTAPSIPTGVR